MSKEPAFPHEFKYGDGTAERADGMSLRDYFAAKVMQAFSTGITIERDCTKQEAEEILFMAAERAYWVADAMLAAREK